MGCASTMRLTLYVLQEDLLWDTAPLSDGVRASGNAPRRLSLRTTRRSAK
jgi:hypothetical protein